MSTANGWKPTLKYSPVNGIIVDWGIGHEPFNIGCLPKPVCPGPAPVPPPAQDCPCGTEPMVEEVSTYDWYRWVPEIIVGIAEASEDMAASYARRAAREFAQKSWVLQRQIAIRLQKGVYRYPLQAFPDEQVQGVLRIESAQGGCSCETTTGPVNIGTVRVDIASQELRIDPGHQSCGCHTGRHGPEFLLVTVWSAPTEDSCKHDVFLYEQYRREITLGARADFISEAHAIGAYRTARGYANSRGDTLIFNRADQARSQFMVAMRKARVEAVNQNALRAAEPEGGSLFGTGCCPGPRYHESRIR